MQVFGYAQAWVDGGLLTEDALQRQAEAWERSADRHPEHDRHRTWRAFLATLVELPIARLEVLLALDLHEASRAPSFGHGIAHDLAMASRTTSPGART